MNADAGSASVRFSGLISIPPDAASDGWPFGGVSGIDYDPSTGIWYLISDDKSEHGPSRFWQGSISLSANASPRLLRLQARRIRQAQGGSFPSPASGQEALDPETIRHVPHRRELIWSSEGDTRNGFGPIIRTMSLSGRSIASLTLPPMFEFDREQTRGPRSNLSIEGMSFEPDGRHFWISLEAPLIQDGHLATRELGAPIRLSRLSYADQILIEQFAYFVEPIGPAPQGRLADNGVSEILALSSRHILVLERSGTQKADGDFAYRSGLYCADTENAENVASLPSLANLPVRAARKQLVFDFGGVQEAAIDNAEGMTLGPTLPNGNRTIILVTDNNFSPRHQTQLIVLEVVLPHANADLVEALCQPVD